MQHRTNTGLATLAWVLEHIGANNEIVARNEVLSIRIHGKPSRGNLLNELIKVNANLCDTNPDAARAERLCGQVNQSLAMYGRTIDENRF